MHFPSDHRYFGAIQRIFKDGALNFQLARKHRSGVGAFLHEIKSWVIHNNRDELKCKQAEDVATALLDALSNKGVWTNAKTHAVPVFTRPDARMVIQWSQQQGYHLILQEPLLLGRWQMHSVLLGFGFQPDQGQDITEKASTEKAVQWQLLAASMNGETRRLFLNAVFFLNKETTLFGSKVTESSRLEHVYMHFDQLDVAVQRAAKIGRVTLSNDLYRKLEIEKTTTGFELVLSSKGPRKVITAFTDEQDKQYQVLKESTYHSWRQPANPPPSAGGQADASAHTFLVHGSGSSDGVVFDAQTIGTYLEQECQELLAKQERVDGTNSLLTDPCNEFYQWFLGADGRYLPEKAFSVEEWTLERQERLAEMATPYLCDSGKLKALFANKSLDSIILAKEILGACFIPYGVINQLKVLSQQMGGAPVVVDGSYSLLGGGYQQSAESLKESLNQVPLGTLVNVAAFSRGVLMTLGVIKEYPDLRFNLLLVDPIKGAGASPVLAHTVIPENVAFCRLVYGGQPFLRRLADRSILSVADPTRTELLVHIAPKMGHREVGCVLGIAGRVEGIEDRVKNAELRAFLCQVPLQGGVVWHDSLRPMKDGPMNPNERLITNPTTSHWILP